MPKKVVSFFQYNNLYDPITGFKGLPDDFFKQPSFELPRVQKSYCANIGTVTSHALCANHHYFAPRKNGRNNTALTHE